MQRISSRDKDYIPGHLSVFPKNKDSYLTLYEAKNNAETTLRQTLSVVAKYIILEDATNFPHHGIIKISLDDKSEPEFIYYGQKIGNQLYFLHRGFLGYSQKNWPAGAKVISPIMAEHQNAIRDAIINIEKKIGLAKNPAADSIHGLITRLENKWLAPKPAFRAYPRNGPAPLSVRFQNFSSGLATRFLWDFGDGMTSTERNPVHIYRNDGIYTVKLNIVSANGPQAVAEKPNYITVNDEQQTPIFYVSPLTGFSIETGNPTEFELVDQSDGDITERHWFFDDGEEITINNPNIHSVLHKYKNPGEYNPSLIIRLSDQRIRRVPAIYTVVVM